MLLPLFLHLLPPNEIAKLITSKAELASSGRADPFATVQVFEKPDSLSLNSLQQLREYADEVYSQQQQQEKKQKKTTEEILKEVVNEDGDLKIFLSMEQVDHFLGEETMKVLTTQFVLIKLLSVEVIVGGRCIDFHTDYAVHTLQIGINDDQEYHGGRLVYAKSNELILPTRPAGTITIHDHTIVHGVTTLEDGIRYDMD
jgi:predicted 2-oxoglutarate/Fe(II)-dependent dioxygenase YbiX